MNLQDIQDRFELKYLVDHFSNLADEKKVAEQMPLFAENAEVITYIGDELFAHAQGHAEIRPLSKPGKGIRFLEFVSLPPPQPSPTGEGAVLRQIQITAVISHMDNYETIAIFAANEFPPPVGEG